jgi:phenylacetate-CoA ligase
MDFNHLFFKYGVYYPIVYLRGEHVRRHQEELSATQWSPAERIESLQNDKLAALLSAAAIHVPYYRDRASRAAAVAPERATQALDSLPFLRKTDIQQAGTRLLHDGHRGPRSVKTTGGSTGQAVTLWKSRDATAREMAAAWRGYGWASIDIGHRQARFWGVPLTAPQRLRARVIDLIGNRRRCSAFAFSDADLARYTRVLNRFKPHYFYGYVSMLDRYAAFLEQSRMRLEFKPRAIITTSEVLTPTHRLHLNQVFDCRVYNEYGCGELGTIAHECEHGALHVNAENLLVEVYDGERRCAPGEIGEIVVTELNNHLMPLIRYRLGDFGALSAASCRCGRALPVLENVAGRAYDLVYNREGRMFHGEFFMYMLEEVKREGLGIEQFQVLQDSFERFRIRVVPGPGYGEPARALIRKRFHEGYGDYADLEFVEVDAIERRPSGKMQLIVGMQATSN